MTSTLQVTYDFDKYQTDHDVITGRLQELEEEIKSTTLSKNYAEAADRYRICSFSTDWNRLLLELPPYEKTFIETRLELDTNLGISLKHEILHYFNKMNSIKHQKMI